MGTRMVFTGLGQRVRVMAIAVVALCSLILTFTPGGNAYADDVVVFPDPGLEAAIRNAIDQPTGDIHASSLLGLTHLDAYNKGILSLEGLQSCPNMKTLHLSRNLITDLSPLSSLQSLRWLTLEHNPIDDSSLAAISQLSLLSTLSLRGTLVTNLSSLSGLTSLQTLVASETPLTTVSGLEAIPTLDLLDISDTPVSDVTPLTAAASLSTLSIRRTSVPDLAQLAGAVSLTSLRAGGDELASLSLVDLPSLLRCDVSDSPVATITALSGLGSLRELLLKRNHLTDVRCLSHLPALEVLHLDENELADISALADLPSLNLLSLDNNELADISALADLPSLNVLSLNGNSLADVSALAHLGPIERLYIEGNRLSDLSPLSSLSTLEYLRADSNEITDLAPLSGLPLLHSIYVRDNMIADLSPLLDCPDLSSVDIRSNPLGAPSVGDDVRELRSRGVSVGWDGPYLDISEVTMEWCISGESYYVRYELENSGMRGAGASTASVTIDGEEVARDECPGLDAGECYSGMTGPYHLSDSMDAIRVCADVDNDVEESREEESCREARMPSEVTLSMAASAGSIGVGQEFDVLVMIDADVPTTGAQCEVAYDPSILRCSGAEEYTFYADNAPPGAFTLALGFPPDIDLDEGRVSPLAVIVIPQPVTPGSGSFIAYHFTALAQGSSSIDISGAMVAGADNRPVEWVNVVDGAVEVTSPAPFPEVCWDLNDDHVCDLSDILAVAGHWREYGPPGWMPADIKPDGVIDLFDIIAVGAHWNETW